MSTRKPEKKSSVDEILRNLTKPGAPAKCSAPSPGIPGEGWGEGGLEQQTTSPVRNHPHPNLLLAYREKGPHALTHIRRTRNPRGYVLLVTLGLLVLSSTLLVAIGRAAAQHALQARLDQTDLQRRWGVITCRSAVLSRTEQLLVTIEQTQSRSTPELRTTIQLGQDSFTLIAADEQAKANVNRLIDQSSLQSAEDQIRQTISGSGLNNKVRLRPSLSVDDSPTSTAQTNQLIQGPGQMFTDVDPQSLIGGRSGSVPPMQCLTCWGNGLLNVMRADQPAMRAAFTPALSQLEIARLIDARNKVMQLSITSHPANITSSNQDALTSLLTTAKIDAGKRNKLALTGRSTCHSLWIIVKDRKRTWYSFTVSDESAKNGPLVQSIVW